MTVHRRTRPAWPWFAITTAALTAWAWTGTRTTMRALNEYERGRG